MRAMLVFSLGFLVACNNSSKDQTLPVVRVEKRDLAQRVTMQGTVESISQQVVIAPYDGNVKKIFVRTGEEVKINDPLIAVESSASLGTAFPLRAGFSGTVTYVGVRLGEYVKSKDDTKVMVRLDDLSKLIVRAKISEGDYPKLKRKQEAQVAIQALPQYLIKGEITEISLAPSEAKRWRGNESIQYEVLVEIKDPPKDLKPGMSVIVDAITAKKSQADSLPHEYVQRQNRKFFVELAPDRKLTEIQVGLQTDEFVEVVGVEAGTQIMPVDFYAEKKN